jgi:hypothetical protein
MLFKFDGMSELRKANTDYSYFLTFTVVGWIDVFTRRSFSSANPMSPLCVLQA